MCFFMLNLLGANLLGANLLGANQNCQCFPFNIKKTFGCGGGRGGVNGNVYNVCN